MEELLGLTELELKNILTTLGEKPFRAAQILSALYAQEATSWDSVTTLSKELRQKLANHLSLSSLRRVKIADSNDGETAKFLFELKDKQLIEAVLIRAPGRRTVCVSSQVGCPARCAFCASGKEGLKRNLTPAEITEQVVHINRYLKASGERVCHVVFMGMGEPFENYGSVLKAIHLINSEEGLNISKRRITVSTVGVIENILRFADEELQVNLALSLHAPNQRLRQKIIPYARKYPLEELLEAMKYFAKKTGRNPTYEYTLLAGINDQVEHAKELAELLRGEPCTVNLIPYNPVLGLKLERPPKEAIEAFRDELERAGISTTWRYTKGKDIAAACGQLALQKTIAAISASLI